MPRMRPLLQLLLERNPSIGKDALYSYIACGNVRVDGGIIRDPKACFPDRAGIELEFRRYVSRGGLKLDAALDHWKIDPAGRIYLDAGASTGGFTDCLLSRGAAKVYAVDVGVNLLDFGLRNDRRVACMEGTNIMSVGRFDPRPNAAVADISFRSLRGVCRHLLSLTRESQLVALVKPQFELREPLPSFRGVLKDDRALLAVLRSVAKDLAAEAAWVEDAMESPIRGRKGNREFFFLVRGRRPPDDVRLDDRLASFF